MNDEPIRAGLIGCGSVSLKGVLPQLRQPDAMALLELVAVCDVVADRAHEAAARFGVESAYADPAELLGRDDIDLVLVITPIPQHYPLALRAIEAGKHVYVQKTIATTAREATELVEAAARRGLTLAAAPGQMLAPSLRQIRALVQQGALGKVYWAFGTVADPGHEYEDTRQGDDVLSATDPSWYYRPGGGPVLDMTVYMLHSLTGILGPARRVTAMSGTGLKQRHWRGTPIPVEVDDNTLLLLDFGDATFAMAGGHNCRGGRLMDWGAMGFYGTDGAIETAEIEPLSGHPARLFVSSTHALPGLELGPDKTYAPPGTLPFVTPAHAALPEPHVYADIMHCVECIRERKPPVASGEHAAHVIEIVEAGYRAARTGETQQLTTTFRTLT